MHTQHFRTQVTMMGTGEEPQGTPRFFMIKSSSEDSVKRSIRDGLWSTTAKNEVLSSLASHTQTYRAIHLPTYPPTYLHATQTQPPIWKNTYTQFMLIAGLTLHARQTILNKAFSTSSRAVLIFSVKQSKHICGYAVINHTVVELGRPSLKRTKLRQHRAKQSHLTCTLFQVMVSRVDSAQTRMWPGDGKTTFHRGSSVQLRWEVKLS
jgi:hypothetical protein